MTNIIFGGSLIYDALLSGNMQIAHYLIEKILGVNNNFGFN